MSIKDHYYCIKRSHSGVPKISFIMRIILFSFHLNKKKVGILDEKKHGRKEKLHQKWSVKFCTNIMVKKNTLYQYYG